MNLYLECPACFWLDKKLGVKRPPPYPFALNTTMDTLLKEEFDAYRNTKEKHPLLQKNGIKADLFSNQKLLNQWRSNFSGIRYYDEDLDATLFGAVDDILEFPDGRLAPLDYKSTGSKVSKVFDQFQLQLDIYTYLIEKNGFKTPRKGYLAFYVVDKSKGFVDRLPFKKEIHMIETNPDDVQDLFKEAVAVLRKDKSPRHSQDCKFNEWLKVAKNYS